MLEHKKTKSTTGVVNKSKTAKKPSFLARLNKLSTKKKIGLTAGVVVLIIAIAVGVFFYLRGHELDSKTSTNSQTQEFEKKLPELKKKVEENGKDTSARRDYATALRATGDLGAAKEQYLEALKYADKDSTLHNNLANIYRDNGEYDQAATHYSRAIELNDKYLNAYINLATMQLYQQKNGDSAVETYKKGIEKLPDDTNLSLQLAMAYEYLDKKDEAKQTAETVLAKDPNNKAAQALIDRLQQ